MRFYKNKNYKLKIYNVIDDEDSVIENDEGDMPAIINLKKDFNWEPIINNYQNKNKKIKEKSIQDEINDDKNKKYLKELSMFDLS